MLNEDSKFEIALDLIEFQIGACLTELEKNKENKELNGMYKELIKTREEIYRGNQNIIEEVIKKARMV